MQRLGRNLTLAFFDMARAPLRGLAAVFLLVVLAGSAISVAGGAVCSKRAGLSLPGAGGGPESVEAGHAHVAPTEASVPAGSTGCVTIVALPAAAAPTIDRHRDGAVDGAMSVLRTGHHPPPPFHPPRLS